MPKRNEIIDPVDIKILSDKYNKLLRVQEMTRKKGKQSDLLLKKTAAETELRKITPGAKKAIKKLETEGEVRSGYEVELKL